jgi:hypothetical protein
MKTQSEQEMYGLYRSWQDSGKSRAECQGKRIGTFEFLLLDKKIQQDRQRRSRPLGRVQAD